MDKTRKHLYRTPQGTEGLLFDEAQRHRTLLEEIHKIYKCWGYRPVQTPVFDFYDLFAPFWDQKDVEKIYRLMDREGDLLVLRPDITLFLARSLALVLPEGQQEHRVWYGDSILRHQDKEDIAANEFFQVGAEFLGSRSPQGDAEVLLLLAEILDFLKLPPTRIHMGSRRLFDQFFKNQDPEILRQLRQVILLRSTEDLRVLLLQTSLDERQQDYGLRLFSHLGEAPEVRALLEEGREASLLSQEAQEALTELLSLRELLHQAHPEGPFVLDLSEIGKQPYYTGVVFQAYTQGQSSAVASGGRYDKLFGHFGLESPSVGFSLLLRKLESVAGEPDRFSSPAPQSLEKEPDFGKRYQQARKLRAQGKAVTL